MQNLPLSLMFWSFICYSFIKAFLTYWRCSNVGYRFRQEPNSTPRDSGSSSSTPSFQDAFWFCSSLNLQLAEEPHQSRVLVALTLFQGLEHSKTFFFSFIDFMSRFRGWTRFFFSRHKMTRISQLCRVAFSIKTFEITLFYLLNLF